MVLTEEELVSWTVDMLKDYLTKRGVTVSGGGSRKADLIRKVLAADLLQLPTLPSVETKIKEISDRRRAKLMVDGIIIRYCRRLDEGVYLLSRCNYGLFTKVCEKKYFRKRFQRGSKSSSCQPR